jgi:hypothetical protein
MSISGKLRSRNSVPLWQVFTCLLLTALFLYNPFPAVSRNSAGLAVGHPASYRGTLASSEVEQFAPPASSSIGLLPNVTDVQVLIPQLAATHSAAPYYVEEAVVATPQTGFSASLWFRPPPPAQYPNHR